MINNKRTISEATQFIATSKDYHEALQRNGWHIPKFSSRLCTEELMQGIRQLQVFCPRRGAITIHPCIAPPAQQVI